MMAIDVELAGIGALETEDGLFLVAHREDGARCRARGLRRQKNSAASLRTMRPLLGAGVLRLVDQDMVDAIVELVEHPLRRVAFFQQRQGLHDQIVIIQYALAILGRVHSRSRTAAIRDQRGVGEPRGAGGAALIVHGAETFACNCVR